MLAVRDELEDVRQHRIAENAAGPGGCLAVVDACGLLDDLLHSWSACPLEGREGSAATLKTGELAFHYCHVPGGQPVTKTRLIRAAGLRWPIESDA